MQILGLDTLGISLARVDYAPLGENSPHTHFRATEIITVHEDTLYVGFVTSNLDVHITPPSSRVAPARAAPEAPHTLANSNQNRALWPLPLLTYVAVAASCPSRTEG